MQCPRDGKALSSEKYEADVVVERCPSCRGMWLDRGELEKVQRASEHDYSNQLSAIGTAARAYEMARQKAQPGVMCPRCQRPLEAEEYAHCSQIIIDRCAECGGIWFDAGEVQALEQFFEQARAEVRQGFWASLLGRLR